MGLQAQRVRPAYEGWNTEAAPDYLSEGQAPLVENLLCRTGKLVLRGPVSSALPLGHTYVDAAAQTVPTYGMVAGHMIVDNKVLLALATEPNDPSPEKQALLTLTSGGFSVAHSTPTASALPVARSAQIGANAYALGAAGQMLRWNGSGAATVMSEANAPAQFVDVLTHMERLWVLGGTVAGGQGGLVSLLFSVPGGPTAFTAADWTDPVSGLINQIRVGDGSELFMGLGRAGREMLILKRHSVWALSGYGANTFSVRRVVDTLGCISTDSIVSADDGCYFLSDSGYFHYSGGAIREVSRDISPTIQAAIRNTTSLTYGPGRLVDDEYRFQRAEYVRGEGILLTMGTETFNGTASPKVPIDGKTQFCALYDITRNAWMKYSSPIHSYGGSSADGLTALVRAGDRTLGFDGWSAAFVDDITVPEAAVLANGVGVGGRDTRVAASGQVGVTAAIPAVWYSRLTRLGSPIERAQLHRLLFDYCFQVGSGVGGDAAAGNGWYVSVVAGDGTLLLPEVQVPAQGFSTAYLARRRASIDVFTEATDAQVRVAWKGTATTLKAAEIYDVTLEYQATHQRSAA